MGKITRIMAGSSLLVVFSAGVAAADASITNTGPGSTNTVNSNTSNTTKVVCINNTLISNSSSQSSSSGSANVSGNTSGGSASSGNASNSNVTSVTASGSCAPGTTPAPAGSPAAQAAAAGRGGLSFNSQGVLAAGGGAGAALPETGTTDTVRNTAIGIASLAGIAAVGQVGLGVYRRRALSL
jgi:hypothetical protein